MASVRMPQLGESITEGTIARWLKQVGEPVKKYESLVEVITDKVNAEVPAPLAGVLREIKVKEGTTVTVGTEICVIEEAGVSQPREPEGLGGPAGMIPEPVAGPAREATLVSPRLSPAVRALMAEHGVSETELSRIQGSGIGGRISKKDLEDFLATRSQPSTAPAPAKPPAGEVLTLSPIRRTIASHMLKSKQTIPHAWTVMEVDMTNVVRARARVKDAFQQREGVELTYVPIVIKAVVDALRANPILNASWQEDRIVQLTAINIGVAVSIDDGLIVPVIHDADKLSIAGLAKAVDDLARRARAGKLTLQEVQGGTFTVNNPGTFGTIISYPIINSPQAAILSMEAIVKKPVILDSDAIAIRHVMNLCLSFDHRVMDGAAAARFLQGVRGRLQDLDSV